MQRYKEIRIYANILMIFNKKKQKNMGNFRIRDFRRAKSLYQEEMASIIGLTQSNLSRYETNDVDLTEGMLDKLRARFGRDAVDEYMKTSASPQNDLSIEGKENPTLLELINIIRRQNEIICQQVSENNSLTSQLANMNGRLLTLLEKLKLE